MNHFEGKPSSDVQGKLNNSINLALRLFLTIDIREEVFAPASTTIQWDDTSTLQDLIERQFPGPRLLDDGGKGRIVPGNDFTAVNLQRIGGVNLDWTCDIKEHLLFDREFRSLKVYTLKSCLYDHKDRLVWSMILFTLPRTITKVNIVGRLSYLHPSSMRLFSR